MSKDSDLDMQKRMQVIMPMLKASFEPDSKFNKWRAENPHLLEVQLFDAMSHALQEKMDNPVGQKWITRVFFDKHAEAIFQECINNIDVLEACNRAFNEYKTGHRPSSITAQVSLPPTSSSSEPVALDRIEIEGIISNINHAWMSLSYSEQQAKKMLNSNLSLFTESQFQSYQNDVIKCMTQIDSIQERARKHLSDPELAEIYFLFSEELNVNTKSISELRSKISLHCPSCPKDEKSPAVIRRARKDLEINKQNSAKPKI